MEVTYRVDKEILYIAVSGRVDASNAAAAEEKIFSIKAENKGKHTVIDAENLEYISLLNPYITHIHVFHWVADQRLPLQAGTDQWKVYLSALSDNHHLLLEFMPDDRILSLAAEAETLNKLIDGYNP